MAKFLISYVSNLISRWKFTCCWLIFAQLSAEQQLPLVKIPNSTNHKKMKNWSCSNNHAFISLKVLLVECLWCNCFTVWRVLFFCGVLLATWLLHLLYYMCLTWEFHVDVATVGYRLAAQQMRFYLWPVQSIHGKNRLIEISFSGFALTCDYLWYYLNNIFVFRVIFQKMKLRLPYFFEVNPPESN